MRRSPLPLQLVLAVDGLDCVLTALRIDTRVHHLHLLAQRVYFVLQGHNVCLDELALELTRHPLAFVACCLRRDALAHLLYLRLAYDRPPFLLQPMFPKRLQRVLPRRNVHDRVVEVQEAVVVLVLPTRHHVNPSLTHANPRVTCMA